MLFQNFKPRLENLTTDWTFWANFGFSDLTVQFEESLFHSLDLQKADYSKINELLSEVNWDNQFQSFRHDSGGNDFVELYLTELYLTVLQACQISSPKKTPNQSPNTPSVLGLGESPRPKTEHSKRRCVLNRNQSP